MLVAVAETATGTGKADCGETTHYSATGRISSFSMRHAAFAALMLFGAIPTRVDAQVVGAGAHAPSVIQTANGIAQANINRPSGAGVSQNTYSQFDVPQAGVILNNSSTLVQTQQAGMINGNANLLPGQAARIILNQVNSNSPSQLRGYIEVAGSKAEVVVANGSGIVVNGGGWINTTRGNAKENLLFWLNPASYMRFYNLIGKGIFTPSLQNPLILIPAIVFFRHAWQESGTRYRRYFLAAFIPLAILSALFGYADEARNFSLAFPAIVLVALNAASRFGQIFSNRQADQVQVQLHARATVEG
jgi:filamentous hemagglutinin family protein